jgi:acetolactate synthase regulatory subunit
VNKFTLQLRVKHSEGALVRILGVTRRRRFDLLHLTADTTEDGHFLDVQMTVQADRAENTLVRQIEKLEDVSQVEVVEPGDTASERRAARSTSAC